MANWKDFSDTDREFWQSSGYSSGTEVARLRERAVSERDNAKAAASIESEARALSTSIMGEVRTLRRHGDVDGLQALSNHMSGRQANGIGGSFVSWEMVIMAGLLGATYFSAKYAFDLVRSAWGNVNPVAGAADPKDAYTRMIVTALEQLDPGGVEDAPQRYSRAIVREMDPPRLGFMRMPRWPAWLTADLESTRNVAAALTLAVRQRAQA